MTSPDDGTTPSRRVALDALLAAHRRGARTVEEELEKRVPRLDDRDRALARELVAGAVRRRGSLDRVINQFSRSGRCSNRTRQILRLALYQLLYLDRIPDHAATASAVELARATDRRAAGYVNGLLRSVIRARRKSEPSDPQALVVSSEAAVVVSGLKFPDLDQEPGQNLAGRYSYPPPLVDRWLRRFGRETTVALLAAGNRAPPLALRVNTRKSTREDFLGQLATAGILAEPGRWPSTVILGQRLDVAHLPGHAQGQCSVQGQVAQRAAQLLEVGPASLVVDLCAAPGAKASHIAELGGDQTELWCIDVDDDRLTRVRQNTDRLGLPPATLVVADARSFTLPTDRPVDRVLVDVPCSNTGVLARRLEARWRFKEAALEGLAAVGAQLLGRGLDLLSPGGRLVYSTCSLEPEENEEVVASQLVQRSQMELQVQERHLPHENHGDGGFCAVITRAAGAD